MDAYVVGAGLFGQVIAANLRSMGMDVEVLDCHEPRGGSGPSASLMKPSWLASMSSLQQDMAYEVLDRLYGIHDLSFKVGPLKVDTVRWCDPKAITGAKHTTARVGAISHGNLYGYLDNADPTVLNEYQWVAPLIIIAMGVWCNRIDDINVPHLSAKMGASTFIRDAHLEQPFINPWAPFKQISAFNMHGGVWVGDSSAIIEKNWTSERRQATVDRCLKAVQHAPGVPPIHDANVYVTEGARPYVPKKHLNGNPCYLDKRTLANGTTLYVATGGAKNGTIAAGWAAAEIARQET